MPLEIYIAGGKHMVPRSPFIKTVKSSSVGAISTTFDSIYKGFWVAIAVASKVDPLANRTFIWKEIT